MIAADAPSAERFQFGFVEGTINRLKEKIGYPPRQAAFDGGFASKENVSIAKRLGVVDVAFHKKRGINVVDMVKQENLPPHQFMLALVSSSG